MIERLRELPEVEEAYKTQGMYDVIVKLRSENKDDMRESVVRVRRVDNISSTLTMIILEEGKKGKLPNVDAVAEYGQLPSPAIKDSAVV